MAPKKKPAKRNASTDKDSDDPICRMNRGYAGVAGLFDTDIPTSLYGLWRRDITQLMRETGIFRLQRAGTDCWSTLHWHAAGLPTMAPREKINYCTDKEIIHTVNMLCQDIAKKVHCRETARDQAISSAEAAHAAHYSRDPPPALSDKPPDLGSPNKKIVMAPPNKTKKDTRSPFPYSGGFTFAAFGWKWQRSKVVTVDDNTIQALHDTAAGWKPLDREVEALWGSRIRSNGDHMYQKLVSNEHVHWLFGRHKEDYLIDIQCELDLSEETSDDQDPDEATLLPLRKRPRRKRGSRSSSPTKPQDKRAKVSKIKNPTSSPLRSPRPSALTKSNSKFMNLKAVKKELAKPMNKGKGKAVSKVQSVDKGKRLVHEPSGPIVKASSHAGPSEHNTGLVRGPVGTSRVIRSTSKMRNPKTTSSAAPKTFPSSPPRWPNTLSRPLYKALGETHVTRKSLPTNATPKKKVEEMLGSFNDATYDIPCAEDDNDEYEDPESSDDDSQNQDTDYEEDG
ncbi:hypothetical protein L211DRAFT_854576 [Terfezia boudieri ATCC MYA-4762]|uniref:Uncharacterized protein n=1 Tax=Terfezia boudieri ATCC MYA-4762 TaxID=1051890 RepID=A0A3N4L543_9PEZI|nr:hypothetical protein L211DRAFT_854576 [Terfezia boudieri ATCC MYA-4762]